VEGYLRSLSTLSTSPMANNDIIAKIQSGGPGELAMIYEEYRNEFLHWIRKEYGCSEDDSKDIYQVTILVFYENIRCGKLENLVSSVKTYLFGIGKNIVRDTMRKSTRHIAIDQERWLKEYLIDDPEESTPERIYTAARNALERLGKPCRKLVELFYYEKKSMDEIVVALNYKNADTAKNQKCKCMKRLRKLCEEEMKRTAITI
jgi:RNA polymerase sigma-70 factor (ECF subfamily)